MASRERVCQRNGGGAVALQVIGLLNGKNPTKAEASEHQAKLAEIRARHAI